jgi:hypothetical protein
VKFTNRCWLMKAVVRAVYAEEAREILADDSSLSILAPVKPITTPGSHGGRGIPVARCEPHAYGASRGVGTIRHAGFSGLFLRGVHQGLAEGRSQTLPTTEFPH